MKKRILALAVAPMILLAACAAPAGEQTAASVKATESETSLVLMNEETSTDKENTTQKGEQNMATQAYPNAPFELMTEWQADQEFALADPAPTNLEELKAAVDVTDPRSVAAYWVLAVNRLTENYDDGMAMMKYLFADRSDSSSHASIMFTTARNVMRSVFTKRTSKEIFTQLYREVKGV